MSRVHIDNVWYTGDPQVITGQLTAECFAHTSFLTSLPIRLRGTTFRNRVWVSPMLQYSATDGLPNTWHLVHLGSLARRWCRPGLHRGHGGLTRRADHRRGHRPVVGRSARGVASHRRVRAQPGAVPGIQLGHSGRKGSDLAPDRGPGHLADRRRWLAAALRRRRLPVPRPASRPPRARARRDPEGRRRLRGRGRAAPSRRGSGDRAARGARLPAAPVPLAAVQPPRRRVRRLVRPPGASGAAGRRRRPRGASATSCHSWCGSPRPTGSTAGGTPPTRSRLAALLATHGADLVDVSTGGNVADARIPVGTWLPGAVRARRTRGRYPHRIGRHDHRAPAGRARSSPRGGRRRARWPGRCSASRTGRCGPPTSSATPTSPAVAWPRQYAQAKL